MTHPLFYLIERRPMPGTAAPLLIRCLTAGPFASRSEAEGFRRRHDLNAAEVRERRELADEIDENAKEVRA